MNAKKFELEKALHELIRDLPELQRIENLFRRGMTTTDSAFSDVARIITEEMENRRNDG